MASTPVSSQTNRIGMAAYSAAHGKSGTAQPSGGAQNVIQPPTHQPNLQASSFVPASTTNAPTAKIVQPTPSPSPADTSSFKDSVQTASLIIAGVAGLLTIGAAINKKLRPALKARSLNAFIEESKPPRMGSYLCSANPQSDAKVCAIIEEAKATPADRACVDKRAPDLLISGPKDVGKVGIGRGIAAALGWPVLTIDLAPVAATGPIPTNFVREIEKAVKNAGTRYKTDGAVIILNGIDKISCPLQEDFARELAASLQRDKSPLKRLAVVIGTLDSENVEGLANKNSAQEKRESAHTPRKDLLDILSNALVSGITVHAPQTPHEIATLLKLKLEDALRRKFQDETIDLTADEFKLVSTVAKALPELRSDDVAARLAEATARTMETRESEMRLPLIDNALNQIEGVRANRGSDPASVELHARQVVCESIVAKALNLEVLAIGVQSRSAGAYVCREHINDCTGDGTFKDATLGAALSEMVVLWARYLGAAGNSKTTLSSIRLAETDVSTKIAALSTRCAQALLFNNDSTSPPEALSSAALALSKKSRETAVAMLNSLQSGENQVQFASAVTRLSSGSRGDVSELCCENLDALLSQFNMQEAQQAFRRFAENPLQQPS
jgi:hypothetical protein